MVTAEERKDINQGQLLPIQLQLIKITETCCKNF